jgi:hypothetical protein
MKERYKNPENIKSHSKIMKKVSNTPESKIKRQLGSLKRKKDKYCCFHNKYMYNNIYIRDNHFNGFCIFR